MNQNNHPDRISDMPDALQQALQRLQTVAAPAALLRSILHAIAEQKELRLFKKHLALCGLALLSFVGTIAIFADALREEIATSALTQYLALAYQDADILISHWQEALLSILDALPVYSLLALLSLSGIIALIFHFSIKHRAFVRAHHSASKPSASFS